MNKRDIIVIGASAGGVSALEQLVRTLPVDFSGSIFVVLHVPPYAPSQLPKILSRVARLKAVHPRDGERIEPGKIYVALQDHHLLVEKECVVVRKGPKENRFRPSIDALFRSAAYVFGSRVIGVVLTGALDDGTSGMWSIKRLGGMVICQDPEEAAFPEMPSSVVKYVEPDYILPLKEMGAVLTRLVSETAFDGNTATEEDLKRLALEVQIATSNNAFEKGVMELGEMAPFTCPSCHGALVRLKEDKRVRYRCHTGHSFSASALMAAITEAVEETLWQAMRGLEETVMLLQHMGEHISDSGDDDTAQIFFTKAMETAGKARVVHDSVFQQELLSGDLQFQK